MGEGARPAGAADAGRIAELAAQARAEIQAERGAAVFMAHELAEAPSPLARVWVGTYDDVVIGYVTVEVEALADRTSLGRLHEVYVEPEARAVGVGEAMVTEAMSWLREQGCRGVDAYALPGMRHTKNFFETFGFTARLLVVHHAFKQ